MAEYDDQCAVIEWSKYHLKEYPELLLLEGSMNGVRLPIGLAIKARNQGMLKGMPDLCLHVSRGDHNGLHIEMKHGKNKPSAHQLHKMALLEEEGRMCVVCYGAQAAIRTIQGYLNSEFKVSHCKRHAQV